MDPRRIPTEVLLALAGAAILLAVLQTLRLAYRRWAARRRFALARERGALGEIRADPILRRAGFSIVGRQVGSQYTLDVDGAPIAVELRADYVVEAGGRRYVAEVKTGTYAPRIETAATRRQLLEYRVAFDVDGVLLVDADAGTVRRVEFPLPSGRGGGGRIGWILVGAAAGALAAIAGRLL